MLFNFQLRPLEAILPWGEPPYERLHWFGLTDGWYWMQVGETALFQYTDAVIQVWRQEYPAAYELPYDDYYIVRFWEDVLDVLPAALEPLPEAIIRELDLPGGLIDWWQRVTLWFSGLDDQAFAAYEQCYYDATQWIADRLLQTFHLAYPPLIGFWTDGRVVHIWWDNRAHSERDFPVWVAQVGSLQLPLETFMDEVDGFHRRLMQAMDERVEQCVSSWNRPEVGIDCDGLVREHRDRSLWLSRTLSRAEQAPPTDWASILDALRTLKTLVPYA